MQDRGPVGAERCPEEVAVDLTIARWVELRKLDEESAARLMLQESLRVACEVCGRFRHGACEAEDVAQETVLRALANECVAIRRCDPTRTLAGWLSGTARRISAEAWRLRSKAVSPKRLHDEPEPVALCAADTTDPDDLGLLRARVLRIPRGCT
jgi:DNA-directed RNA polymerase specialized sigma24 family protein